MTSAFPTPGPWRTGKGKAMGRVKIIRLTGGAVLALGGIVLFASFLFYAILSGRSFWETVFREKKIQAVYASAESIEDTALLDCAVYRLRAVYPFDFPGVAEKLPLLKPDEFCVISARIAAGYDLSALPLPEGTGDRLVWALGEPRITSFIIEDGIMKKEGFPDVEITPEEWRLIVENITPLIRQMAVERGIMEEAEQFSREYLTRLFKGAGYDQILFTD